MERPAAPLAGGPVLYRGEAHRPILGCEGGEIPPYPLTDWLNTLLETAFALERVVEPWPDPSPMDAGHGGRAAPP